MAVERAVPTDRAGREGGHVVEMQRRRLLSATVELAYERGAQALTVATICKRSGLSRKTFYDIFDEREDCLRATFEGAVEQATRVVREAVSGEAHNAGGPNGARKAQSWREQARAGLIALLLFFDREPGIGRLLIVEALSSGPQTLQARGQVLREVIAFVDRGRREVRKGQQPPPLTAEGIVGAVLAVLHARMVARLSVAVGGAQAVRGSEAGSGDGAPLVELTGPLMAMIVQPYLGASVARRELGRSNMVVADRATPNLPTDPFKDLPIRFTYRTARVLNSIAHAPGASSKQIAQASGISDEGQTSRLLARLQHHNLIRDRGVGPSKGLPRAWTLTERGEQILQAVGAD
jgi:AcrR family transcriptional regulator